MTLRLLGQHEQVEGVEQLLREMLYNLCDNAIKYNVPGGSVTVNVWRNGQHPCVSVSDTGIGIPQADQERIFERFYRVGQEPFQGRRRDGPWPVHRQARRAVPRRAA